MTGAVHLTRLEERFGEAPAIEVARAGLRDVADRAWVVGGAVRDAILGGDVIDVDIAFDGTTGWMPADAPPCTEQATGHTASRRLSVAASVSP